MKGKLSIGVVALTFIWVGMIIGISFLEAPLKFQAPGITLELGLGIGQLVFGVLTKFEMAYSLFIIAFLLLSDGKRSLLLFAVPILIVVVDNAYLLPILDNRIDMITRGVSPLESNAHWWYVALEAIKLISLLIGGYIYSSKLLINNSPRN